MTATDSGPSTHRLGRYHLSESLGGGPTGEVYRAKVYGIAGMERDFAVKRFHPTFVTGSAAAAEIAVAAQLYGSLDHPKIAKLQELGVSDDQTFTAVEFVPGVDLSQLIDHEKLPLGAAARLVIEIGRAVGYAHGRSMTHLGLAPTNVICTERGEIKVTDFGFLPSRLPRRPAEDVSLQARLCYLAPEQLEGADCSAATDVYQLGTIAFELMVGRKPYAGRTGAALAQQILGSSPPESGLSRQFQKLLARALARRPVDRYPDAGAFADAIEAALRSAPAEGNLDDVGAMVSEREVFLASTRESQASGALTFSIPAPPKADRAAALNVTTPPPIPTGPPRTPHSSLGRIKLKKKIVRTTLLGRPPAIPKVPDEEIELLEDDFDMALLPDDDNAADTVPSLDTPIAKDRDSSGLLLGPAGTDATATRAQFIGGEINENTSGVEDTLLEPASSTRATEEVTSPAGLARASGQVTSPAGLARDAGLVREKEEATWPGPMASDTKEVESAASRARTSEELPSATDLAWDTEEDSEPTRVSPAPSVAPSVAPISVPSVAPIAAESVAPITAESVAPIAAPIAAPSVAPIAVPSVAPIVAESVAPIAAPISVPSVPIAAPISVPSVSPIAAPQANFPPALEDVIITPPPLYGVSAKPIPKFLLYPGMALVVGVVAFLTFSLLAADDETKAKRNTKVATAQGAGEQDAATELAPAIDAKNSDSPPVDSPPVDAARAAAKSWDAAPVALAKVADADLPLVPPPVPPPTFSGEGLQITSTPAGAKVYLDGSLVGNTPLTLEASGDSHRLALILPGYALHTADVAGTGPVNVSLSEVVPPGGPGGIKVRCKKKDRYYVFVDGHAVGELCPTERIGVSRGKHVVEIYDPVTDSRRQFRALVEETRLSVRVRVD